LPERLAAHRRNYTHVADGLAGLDAIALRRPVAPDAFLGEALVFRIPGAGQHTTSWFAAALRAEGFDARALGDATDPNVRAFWNWRFMFPDPAEARDAFPVTSRYLGETVDVPLSANLTPSDCDQLVTAVRKVAAALPGHA
jgi:dTDP-4-amino-4,6-dideoxygalactose transaminase